MTKTLLDAFCAHLVFAKQTTRCLVMCIGSLQRVFTLYIKVNNTYKNIFDFWLLKIMVFVLVNK